MRVKTTIQIEREDNLRMEDMDVALNLVGLGQITREFRDSREDRPPLVRAIGALRGNMFTLDDLDVIIEGIETEAKKLCVEKEVFRDEKLNRLFYDGVRANSRRAVSMAHTFREDLFETMRSTENAGSD